MNRVRIVEEVPEIEKYKLTQIQYQEVQDNFPQI